MTSGTIQGPETGEGGRNFMVEFQWRRRWCVCVCVLVSGELDPSNPPLSSLASLSSRLSARYQPSKRCPQINLQPPSDWLKMKQEMKPFILTHYKCVLLSALVSVFILSSHSFRPPGFSFWSLHNFFFVLIIILLCKLKIKILSLPHRHKHLQFVYTDKLQEWVKMQPMFDVFILFLSYFLIFCTFLRPSRR